MMYTNVRMIFGFLLVPQMRTMADVITIYGQQVLNRTRIVLRTKFHKILQGLRTVQFQQLVWLLLFFFNCFDKISCSPLTIT